MKHQHIPLNHQQLCPNLTFYDLYPPATDMLAEVSQSLCAPNPSLHPKYFYDEAGLPCLTASPAPRSTTPPVLKPRCSPTTLKKSRHDSINHKPLPSPVPEAVKKSDYCWMPGSPATTCHWKFPASACSVPLTNWLMTFPTCTSAPCAPITARPWPCPKPWQNRAGWCFSRLHHWQF